MPFDEDLVKSVLKNSDIVKVVSNYLSVTKKGKNFVAICPFHDDTNPSMSISPERQMFKCFVCNEGGSAIAFVQKYEHIKFPEAVKKVAEISGYSDPRLESFTKVKKVDETKAPLYKCLHDLTLYYQYALNTPEGKDGLDYFEKRHLDSEMRNKYHLGYAFLDGKATVEFLQSKKGHSIKTIEDTGIAAMMGGAYADKNQGRVIFPICDKEGNVIGYSARRIKDGPEAKYINSPETKLFHKSSVLYNYHIAKEKARMDKFVYVCEGFMDVFALAKIGIDSAVAIMGTALTSEHIEMLRALNVEIRLCLDGDLPGQQAMMKASKQLADAGLNCRIVDNRNSPKDPDEILNQDGPDALRAYLNNLVNRVEFALNYYQNSNPLKTNEQKKELIKAFIPILLSLRSALDLDNYLRKLSKITGYDVESLRQLVEKARNNKSQYENPVNVMRDFHPERKVLRRLELAERELLYQMINNPSAVIYYEQKIGGFYDEVYRQIANFVVDYAMQHPEFSAIDLMAALEASDVDNKDQLTKEMSELCLEQNHPNNCSDQLLNNLGDSIDKEKEKIYQEDMLQQSLEGKDPLEQARILAEFNRRKMKKNEQ